MSGSISFLREFRPPADLVRGALPPSVDEAYQAGVIEGRALERTRIDEETSLALSNIKTALEKNLIERQTISCAVQREAAAAVASVVRALCPSLARSGLSDAAQTVLTDALKAVPRPIAVTAPSNVSEIMRDALDGDDDSELEFRDDADPSALRVDFAWSGGSAEVDLQGVVDRILALADTLEAAPSTPKESDE